MPGTHCCAFLIKSLLCKRHFSDISVTLEHHGCTASEEIEKVRAGLEMQRDLDGIDTSNIVSGGRRRAAAPPSIPSKPAKHRKVSAGVPLSRRLDEFRGFARHGGSTLRLPMHDSLAPLRAACCLENHC